MEQKIKDAEQWYNKNKALHERFSKEVEEIIIKILQAQKIPYQSVSHRLKEKESYLNKCRNEKYTNPIDQIMDVSGSLHIQIRMFQPLNMIEITNLQACCQMK